MIPGYGGECFCDACEGINDCLECKQATQNENMICDECMSKKVSND